MPLQFVLDEHLRGPLWLAIQRHNVLGAYPIDAVRVGDHPKLPCGSDDPSILEWACEHDRIVVTQDTHTMPTPLESRIGKGQESPGINMIRTHQRISDIVEALQLIADAGQIGGFQSSVSFIP